jgi:hypothetical protein
LDPPVCAASENRRLALSVVAAVVLLIIVPKHRADTRTEQLGGRFFMADFSNGWDKLEISVSSAIIALLRCIIGID